VTHRVVSHFGSVFTLSVKLRYVYSQATRSNFCRYLHVLKYLLLLYSKSRKDLCRQIDLQTSNWEIFVKLSRSDVCKPTRLHHFFLRTCIRIWQNTAWSAVSIILVMLAMWVVSAVVLAHAVADDGCCPLYAPSRGVNALVKVAGSYHFRQLLVFGVRSIKALKTLKCTIN